MVPSGPLFGTIWTPPSAFATDCEEPEGLGLNSGERTQPMSRVSYFGVREGGEARVFRHREHSDPEQGVPLPPRLDLRGHSPTGFEWGYGGSGPAQLSLAILADYLGNDREAQEYYQDFKFAVIGGLPRDQSWSLSDTEIDAALHEIRLKRDRAFFGAKA